MTPSEIIEKIRALLRLAKSDNPHEAALALEKAATLAARHHLDLGAISPDDDSRKIGHGHLDVPDRLAQEWKEALNTVHNYFHVHITVLKGSSKCLVVGTALDIELASYVATFLVRCCRDSLSSWKKSEKAAHRKITRSKVFSFIEGFFWGIRHKLRANQTTTEVENSGFALLLEGEHEARSAAATTILGGPSTTITMPEARRDKRSSFRGFLNGQQTDLNPGLKGGQPQPLALC
jgi:hypothetical protein